MGETYGGSEFVDVEDDSMLETLEVMSPIDMDMDMDMDMLMVDVEAGMDPSADDIPPPPEHVP